MRGSLRRRAFRSFDRRMAPFRVMLDSNAFDVLALDDVVRANIERHVSDGIVELVITHIQADELNKTPDDDLRRRLLRLTVVATYTAGFVIGLSRLDMAALMTEEEVGIYNAVVAGNPTKNAEDAVILLTARHDGLPVVTNERRLPNQCRLHGVRAWNTDEFLAQLC